MPLGGRHYIIVINVHIICTYILHRQPRYVDTKPVLPCTQAGSAVPVITQKCFLPSLDGLNPLHGLRMRSCHQMFSCSDADAVPKVQKVIARHRKYMCQPALQEEAAQHHQQELA